MVECVLSNNKERGWKYDLGKNFRQRQKIFFLFTNGGQVATIQKPRLRSFCTVLKKVATILFFVSLSGVFLSLNKPSAKALFNPATHNGNEQRLKQAQQDQKKICYPPPSSLRAVWIATVENIDWPASRLLTAEQQKASFAKLMETYRDAGFNAVFVQVRPCADAFWKSKQEPYSVYLTGTQGKDPGYEPLPFMIQEAHRCGLEFHAWLNPYRAVQNLKTNKLTADHITKKHPEWFLTYGNQKLFNPGLPEVWQYFTGIVTELVNNYDIDGIHLDDYFYPYRIAGKPFPDWQTYTLYGNGMNKEDWRRHNVDTVIHLLHDTIHKLKPWMPFGVSPFGVWRNKSKDQLGSETRAGQTNYDDLYADVRKWLKLGWTDYVVPQLYWETGHPLCDYETLLHWWADNSFGKPVFVGHASYRQGEKGCWAGTAEMEKQLALAEKHEHIFGDVFYNSNSMERKPLGKALLKKLAETKQAPFDWITASDLKAEPPLKIWGCRAISLNEQPCLLLNLGYASSQHIEIEGEGKPEGRTLMVVREDGAYCIQLADEKAKSAWILRDNKQKAWYRIIVSNGLARMEYLGN